MAPGGRAVVSASKVSFIVCLSAVPAEEVFRYLTTTEANQTEPRISDIFEECVF